MIITHFLLIYLKAARGFTLCKNRESCVPCGRDTQQLCYTAYAGKGQFASLKINYGTRFFEKIGAEQTGRICGKRTY
jgi:hypothetical protein